MNLTKTFLYINTCPKYAVITHMLHQTLVQTAGFDGNKLCFNSVQILSFSYKAVVEFYFKNTIIVNINVSPSV